MKDYDLPLISNKDLMTHVAKTIQKYHSKDHNNYFIDPIKLYFDSKILGQNCEKLVKKIPEIDNIIYFHKNIFKYIGGDWNTEHDIFDAFNITDKTFIKFIPSYEEFEMQERIDLYMHMQNILLEYDRQGHCYLVDHSLSMNSNSAWELSYDELRFSYDKIRILSIDELYKAITNDPCAYVSLTESTKQILSKIE